MAFLKLQVEIVSIKIVTGDLIYYLLISGDR